ncbi:MAG: ribonuclease III [Chloroflexota bacterium]
MTAIEGCEARLGLTFRDRALLEQAFVHGSYVNESGVSDINSNERLEFLGDAVLGLATADELYRTHPAEPEGYLTRARAAVVRKETLALVADDLGIGDCLKLGKGEESTGGRLKPGNLANALEAVIGAAYLDQGYDAARMLVLKHLGSHLELALDHELADNYKAMLQEYLQAKDEPLPRYRTVGIDGPDHKKQFTVKVFLRGESIGEGAGRTKKLAEVAAARSAWKRLYQKEASDHGQER